MHGYKYPPNWTDAQKRQSCKPGSLTEIHGKPKRLKMLCSRSTLPVLTLCLLLEEISAAVLPSRFRGKREVSWPDHELFSRLPERTEWGDLSVGDAVETGWGVDGRPSHSETSLAFAHQPRRQPQYQHHRKAHEKRRKVAPLDSIGSFQMSSFQNRKDEPGVDWEDYRD